VWSAGLSHDGLRLAYQVATFSVCAMESVLDASRLCSPHSGFWLCQGNLLAVAGRITGLSGTSVCDIVPVFCGSCSDRLVGRILLDVGDGLFWDLSSYPYNFSYTLSSSRRATLSTLLPTSGSSRFVLRCLV